MRIARVLLVAVPVTLAGCLQPTALGEPGDSSQEIAVDWQSLGASIYNETHDHWDRAVHVPIEKGLRVLEASALSPDGRSLGLYTEADSARGLLAVAVQIPSPPTLRAVLFDADALPAVVVVGSFDEPEASGDIKLDREVPLAYVPYPAASKGRGFAIWDITDPGSPRRLGEAPGGGCHMLHPMRAAGTSYVWCAGFGAPQLYEILRLQDGSAQGVPVTYALPQQDPEVTHYTDYYGTTGLLTLLAPHDMTAQNDPITGTPLLVSAHELQGIRIFDVSNPRIPVELARWHGDGAPQPMERIHTVGLVEIGERRIGVGASETFFNAQPVLYFVDFTDYGNPRYLASWSPPGIPTDQKLVYSLHNFQVVGTRLYLSAFHAGLWVLDVSDPSQPAPIALRSPVRDTEYPVPGQVGKDLNQFWDVQVHRGFVIVTDMPAGIEVLRVDGDPEGSTDWGGHF